MQVGAAQSTSGSPVSLPWQKRTRKGRKEKHSYKNRLWWQLHPPAMNPSGLWVSQPLFPSFLLHHHLRRSPSSYRKMCKHSSNLDNTSLSPSHLLKPNLWSNPPTRIRCLSRDELSHHLGRDFLVLWFVRIKNECGLFRVEATVTRCMYTRFTGSQKLKIGKPRGDSCSS